MENILVHDAICEELAGYAKQDFAAKIINSSKELLKGNLMMFIRCMVDDLIFDFGLEHVETTIAKLINANADKFVQASRLWAASITPEKLDRQVYHDPDNHALLTMCSLELMIKRYAKA